MTITPERAAERDDVLAKARAAKAVAPRLATLPTPEKDALLHAAADELIARTDDILAANQRDIEAGREEGLDEALIDRLALSAERIEGIASGLRQVAGLKDPVGEVLRGGIMPNGITMKQVRVPLGVMGMVYEARPNVTVDAFGLALKSGNVALLRGSKSARQSNAALVGILQGVAASRGLPREIVQLLPCDTHDSVQDLITARGLVDVVIPRGGARLIEAVVTNATVPAIETGTGNCHFYIDRDADLDSAIEMLLNGKTRRVSVCNATETALIDAALPATDQLRIITALQEAGVRVHGDADKLGAWCARHCSGDGRGLGRGVSLHGYCRADCRRCRRRDRAHRALFDDAHRSHRVSECDYFAEVRCGGGCSGRHAQRVHRVHRRGAVRNGGRNWNLHPEAARPRTHGVTRADQHKVDPRGGWAHASLTGVLPPRG